MIGPLLVLTILLLVNLMLATNRFPRRGVYFSWKRGIFSFNEGGTLGVVVGVGWPVKEGREFWWLYLAVGFVRWWKRKHWRWGEKETKNV